MANVRTLDSLARESGGHRYPRTVDTVDVIEHKIQNNRYYGTTTINGNAQVIFGNVYNGIHNGSPTATYAELVQILGSGTFGVVLKVRRWSDGKELVCKTLQYDKPLPGPGRLAVARRKRKARIAEECEILMAIRHKHIVRYVHHIWEEDLEPKPQCNLYMELCENGDLSTYIENELRGRQTYPREIEVNRVVKQLSAALAYCHKGVTYSDSRGRQVEPNWRPILHRDIKPKNIFIYRLSRNGQINVKLGDFGLGAIVTDTRKLSTYVGTPIFMPPEVQRGATDWTTKCDIFSLGCTLFEYVTTEEPFEDHLRSEDDLPSPPSEGICSTSLSLLIMSCLEIDPGVRPSACFIYEAYGSTGAVPEST